MFSFPLEREAGGKAEMGFATPWQIAKGYHAGIPGGLCIEYYGKETSDVCPQQS